MEKLGDVKAMAWGSVFSMTFVISLIIPALKSEDMKSDSFFYSSDFVYPLMLFASISTGAG